MQYSVHFFHITLRAELGTWHCTALECASYCILYPKPPHRRFFKWWVSFAKEPYKKDYILQTRPRMCIILRTVSTWIPACSVVTVVTSCVDTQNFFCRYRRSLLCIYCIYRSSSVDTQNFFCIYRRSLLCIYCIYRSSSVDTQNFFCRYTIL